LSLRPEETGSFIAKAEGTRFVFAGLPSSS
jgi:hypothetical protein